MSCEKCWRRKLHQCGPSLFSSSFQRSDLKNRNLWPHETQILSSKKNTHTLREKFHVIYQTEFLTQKPVGTVSNNEKWTSWKKWKSLKAGKELSALLSTCLVGFGNVGFRVNNMPRAWCSCCNWNHHKDHSNCVQNSNTDAFLLLWFSTCLIASFNR